MTSLLARDDGSAALDATFAIALLMLLALGVVQVALALYARNVVAASAHEGARAAVERGRGSDDAVTAATLTVRRATGGLVERLGVDVGVITRGDVVLIVVSVSGRVASWGPVPLPIPVEARATASTEADL